ncbi:hypothetical protein HY641_03485 [Candidatus Woesearchaeota archaeon]|nr:hypothetical protein [Candidatus Woesearchaeota archaeon]
MDSILDWRKVENLSNRSLAICAHLHRLCKDARSYKLTPSQSHSLEQLEHHVESFFHTASFIAHTLERSTINHRHLFKIDHELKSELHQIQKQFSRSGAVLWPDFAPSIKQESRDISFRLRDGEYAVHDALVRLHHRIRERVAHPRPMIVREQASSCFVDPQTKNDFHDFTLKYYGVLDALHTHLKRDDRFDEEMRKRFERAYSVFGENQAGVDLTHKIGEWERAY